MNADLQRCLGAAAIIFSICAGLGACSAGVGLGTYLSDKPMVQLQFRGSHDR